MLHGKGDQYWMTNTYEDDRNKVMLDRTKYDNDKLTEVDLLDKPQYGGGRTNPDTWEIWQYPFPMDTSIRQRKKVNIKNLDPAVGDGSD